MSEQANFIEESADRIGEAYRSIDAGFQRLQKDLSGRRKSFEKQVNSGRKGLERRITAGRKDVEKRTRQQVKELRKNPVVKRAISAREDATKQLESRVSSFLGFFNIATRSDVERLERKIVQITRKLKPPVRSKKTNGSATAKAS